MGPLLLAAFLLAAPAAAQSVAPIASVTTDAATPFSGAIWVTPATPGPHPVLIVLGGSEGGTSTARTYAPLFAAQGYATLGLPYYNPGWDPTDKTDGLPTSFQDIPVDRLQQARDWIAKQPQADVRRIGVWGVSKGAEFALIAASRYPWIKAVAAIVPSDVVWEGWGPSGPGRPSFSFNGKPLPFQPYDGLAEAQAEANAGKGFDVLRIHEDGLRLHPEALAAARIPVERICGPVLVAGGGQDKVWPSFAMARSIAATRAMAGRPTVALFYPKAGHAISGPPKPPSANAVALGGTAAAIEQAQAGVWTATLKMFGDTLKAAKAPREGRC